MQVTCCYVFCSWYHGSISRHNAEQLLRMCREGSYLVRTSESNRLDYSLSVRWETLSSVYYLLSYVFFFFVYTSGLPGRRPITTRAGGTCKKAPGRAVYDKFVNVWFIKFASALATRPLAVSPATVSPTLRYVRYVARATSVVAPVPFVNLILSRNRQFCTVFRNFSV